MPDVYIISKFDTSIQSAIQENSCTCSRGIGINGDRGEDLCYVRPEIGDRRLLEDLGRENSELPDACYDQEAACEEVGYEYKRYVAISNSIGYVIVRVVFRYNITKDNQEQNEKI